MIMKINAGVLLLGIAAVSIVPSKAWAQDAGVVAQACTQAGVCGDIEPVTALIIVALAQLANELSKEKPFGKNNELVKGITNMINDLKNGPGPGNDAVKIFNNIGNDLKCGPGPNNEVIKLLNGLGIKISVTGCK
jgi:hypothetical protein